jgi:DtxR family transcriptional regulator, Mn-dependent transcriptional regulator
MRSLAEENYLKALFTLGDAQGEVSVTDLSRHLDIKMPTVNSMMKRLSEKNLVYYESYKPLRLTDSGKKEAALIIRKHRLTEMYLVEKMGFGWEQVHEIAEQIEHIHAPLFFAKMDELLGYPKVDPHGSPIPDKEGRMEWLSYRKLNECSPNEDTVLLAVTNSSEDFLRFLNSRNLKLGTRLKVLAIEAFDGSMTIQYNDRTAETISALVAEKLLVK